jgi:hypothetical protein
MGENRSVERPWGCTYLLENCEFNEELLTLTRDEMSKCPKRGKRVGITSVWIIIPSSSFGRDDVSSIWFVLIASVLALVGHIS